MKRLLVMGALLLAACGDRYPKVGAAGGNPARGKRLVETRYACTGCHSIPDIDGPRGWVGPPLDRIAIRQILAGKLRNTPDNMVRWLQDPQAIVPGNAMPNLNITEADARDITAFLYTLK